MMRGSLVLLFALLLGTEAVPSRAATSGVFGAISNQGVAALAPPAGTQTVDHVSESTGTPPTPDAPLPSETLLRLGLPLLTERSDGSYHLRIVNDTDSDEGDLIQLRLGTDHLRKLVYVFRSIGNAESDYDKGLIDVAVKVEPETLNGESLAGVELRLPQQYLSLSHEQEPNGTLTTIQVEAPW